ncbi:Paraquat resistance protein [Neorhizobium galegae bv. officinalis bv. officinalis str. HAMBI 1141]|uniref:Paraquat resistance protein n=1 Tax=Neorhizobium galegae bv. officinalis bv. officinalis str. HAMBI 1141 TaxID=1028801 RepID=A0A068T5H3_NEOGA|nr:MFS transporter [Neorhizobium galegae]CDN53319.1 Paraquat resistance protein [Neorhizobium galegae bv. officinalis bv. officinalis str. HAMBI 1141]
MPNPYREIFARPGTKGFSAAAFVARLPLPMTTIGLVAMLSQTHGEYWLAGAVSATFALANAFISPQVSRWVDAKGQSAVLVPTTFVTFFALIGLAAAAWMRWPIWTLFAFALVAGLMPSMMALVRARWSEIYRERPELHTAFAFESVIDELVYICGPVFGIGLSVALFPEAGVLASAAFLAVGTTLFVVQKSTEPKVDPQRMKGGGSVMRLPAMWFLVVLCAGMGVIFGTAEVSVVAFSEAMGNKGAASYILSAYAAGSFVVGIVFGAIKFKSSLARRLLLASLVAAVTTLPMPFVGSLWGLTAVIFLAGAAISPTFISAMTLIERIVPSSQVTEGITYAMTGMSIGFATGSSLAGWTIDAYGASNGFWVAVAGGALALTTMLAGYGLLSRPDRQAVPGAGALNPAE